MATAFNLRVFALKGGAPTELSVDPETSGQDLRIRVQEEIGIDSSVEIVFLFQNGSRNALTSPLDEGQTLAAQGVEDGASIIVRDKEQHVTSEDSVLRMSIAKNGGQSYYYAHANEKELPPELRYVYGGAPILLAEPGPTEAEKAPPEILARPISKYSWADEVDFVCVYISADGEADAVAAAGDGQVDVNFESRSFELKICTDSKVFALVIKELEHEIIPEDSKHRVSKGKRITLKLKKRRAGQWMRLVRPPK